MLFIQQDTPNSTAIKSWYFISTHETYEKGVLVVTFTWGAKYGYFACPSAYAFGMAQQASVGRYFATVVKPNIPKDDVVRVTDEIAEIIAHA